MLFINSKKRTTLIQDVNNRGNTVWVGVADKTGFSVLPLHYVSINLNFAKTVHSLISLKTVHCGLTQYN